MKLFISISGSDYFRFNEELKECKYALISFAYIGSITKKEIATFDDFMMDSGAFTFMATQQDATEKELEGFFEKYIHYLKENKVKHFAEMDIDPLIGYDKVKQWRKRLEREIGRQCIPIWHHSRGKEDFERMCQEYDYAGIGGIVTREPVAKKKKLFPELNKRAKQLGCRLHGMGYTPAIGLKESRFYSVDSASFASAERFGFIYEFDRGRLVSRKRQPNERFKDRKALRGHSILQWIEYQKEADRWTW